MNDEHERLGVTLTILLLIALLGWASSWPS